MRSPALAVGLLSAIALSACGGGGAATSAPVAATSTPVSAISAPNQALVQVEQNPDITALVPHLATVNMPYVTVTVCADTGACKAVDHVVVDTGSYGLRLLQSAVGGLDLPVQTLAGSQAQLGECAAFISGYMWGSVRKATVKIAGETAVGLPIHVLGDPAWTYGVPEQCAHSTAGGADLGTLLGLKGNGLLGIGQEIADGQRYYACTAQGCQPTALPSALQVSNPVASFARDNNGVILGMPALPATGASVAYGVLTFGIGTQANNRIDGYSLLPLGAADDFIVNLQGVDYSRSFVDSGSNFYFINLNQMPTLRHDGTTEYAPAAGTSFNIALRARGEPIARMSATIRVVDPTTLDYSVSKAFDDIAARSWGESGDLGLPFFYGRQVALVFRGRPSPQGSGPLLALH